MRAIYFLWVFSLLIISFLLTSCNSFEYEVVVEDQYDWAESEGQRNVLRRADLLARIKWTPINNIPNNVDVYQAGQVYTGIPYSSTKQINKYVGLDVSFYTFLSALRNPNSVLYTENIGRSPYFGVNCACYYGTVCSTAVVFALGIEIPYPSAFFPELDEFELITFNSLSALKVGDVAFRPGHVFMIYRLYQSNDSVQEVTYLESAGTMTVLRTCSADSFQAQIIEQNLSFYRYKNIDLVKDYSGKGMVISGDESLQSIRYNNSLCPNRGDKCVYRFDEDVIVDIFDFSYDYLELQKDKETIIKVGIEGEVHNLGVLPPGKYVAFLSKEGKASNEVSFLVAEPKVDVSRKDNVFISFSCSDAIPVYCVITNEVGDFLFIYTFNETDIISGFIYLNKMDEEEHYYKVVFKTEYGTVVNSPIKA